MCDLLLKGLCGCFPDNITFQGNCRMDLTTHHQTGS